jgi:predicted O-methyltransferase YrrM
MDDYTNKIDRNLFDLIQNIENPVILELGVQNGLSTKKFLDICNKNNGFLYSVDIDDCSNVSNDKKWTFIKSRDDDFDLIKSQIPKEIDILYIDSLHEADHVSKIIFEYYNLIKVGGFIFIDDISHLPYVKNGVRNNFYCEINNQETFNILLEIYFSNYDKIDLNFSFVSSGLAIIKKKNNKILDKKIKVKSRKFSFKNIIRKLVHLIKKNR